MMDRSRVPRALGIAAAGAAAFAFLVVHAGLLVTAACRDAAIQTATGVAAAAQALILHTDLAAADTILGSAARLRVAVTVIREDGVVIAASDSDPAAMRNQIAFAEVDEALAGRVGTVHREGVAYVALPIVDHPEARIVVRGAVNVRDGLPAGHGLRVRSGLAAAVVSVILMLWALVVDMRQRRGCAAIQRAAKQFGGGNLDHRVSVAGSWHLRGVAEALNAMAERVRREMSDTRTERDELRTALSNMGEAVAVLDRDLRIRSMNAAASDLTGVEENEARGRNLLEVFRNSELFALATAAMEETTPLEKSITLVAERETTLQVRATTDPRRERVVLVLKDITRLLGLEKMRRDFVANVSHELKTPITTVKGYLETLLDGTLMEDQTTSRKFLQIAAANVDRLTAILDDLLSLSRLEHQGPGPGHQGCDLRDLVAAAIHVCAPSARQKSIRVEAHGGEPLMVRASPLLLEQALANLIDNAIKYSKAGSVVDVELRQDGHNVAIAVTDRGIGIPRKALQRVFERFYRVDQARSRELGGTGLGLAIVKHIALAHGGSVAVESVLGHGSTFTLSIPASLT